MSLGALGGEEVCSVVGRACRFAAICPGNGAPAGALPAIPPSWAMEEAQVAAAQFEFGLRRVLKLEGNDFAGEAGPRWLATHVSHPYVAQWIEPPGQSALVVARTQADLDRFIACNSDLDPAQRMRGCGELLGYPSCCVEHYLARVSTVSLADTTETDRLLDDEFGLPICPLVVRLCGVVSHRACSPVCRPSAALGEATLAAIKSADEQKQFVRELAVVWATQRAK